MRNHDGLTFVIPQARTTSYLKNVIPSTIKIWNVLYLGHQKSPIIVFFLKQYFKTPDRLFLILGIAENIIQCPQIGVQIKSNETRRETKNSKILTELKITLKPAIPFDTRRRIQT